MADDPVIPEISMGSIDKSASSGSRRSAGGRLWISLAGKRDSVVYPRLRGGYYWSTLKSFVLLKTTILLALLLAGLLALVIELR